MEGVACIGVTLLAVIAVGSIIFYFHQLHQQAMEEAKVKYQGSLEQLKQDPHNPELREHTLALGRKYASLTRNNQGVALFDEVALMNDINAACARAGSKDTAKPDTSIASVEERLEKLDTLLSKQLISQREYQSRREQILNKL